ncbi:putative nuclease HARBI1 [Lates japonicus]|uniref:Nuclease HARBI1 n=1 Tax=Lates japonicus TaxID=270547 RepID=A0AAD3MW65_LATJO|nr:putative nuclease HARBI1 [Lates japonicus]
MTSWVVRLLASDVCSIQSVREEDYISLSLNVLPGGTTDRSLQEYLKEGHLEYQCQCGIEDLTQQYSFLTLPKFGESRWPACLVYRHYPGFEASVMPLSSHEEEETTKAIGLSSAVGAQGPYCRVNPNVPLLPLYFGEGDLRKDFRLLRPTVEELIHLLGDNDHGWGKAFEVLVFVYWLACGTSYRVVSEAFDIPRTTCHGMVHRVSKDIQGVFRRVIRFPTRNELEEIGAGFQQLSGSPAFNKVAGSIDGCHVWIVPPGRFAADYFNRKLFLSVQFQAICDHKGRFLDVTVGFPGCVHDARVLRCSLFYVHQLYPPPGWYLIGDGGYPCLVEPICLMTPFREPVRNAVEASSLRKVRRETLTSSMASNHFQFAAVASPPSVLTPVLGAFSL